MAKRISKKLLVGLGGTLGTASAVGVATVIVTNAINISNSPNWANQINFLTDRPVSDFPDLNKVDSSMFINPAGLTRFHFGDIRKGQTVTPWGWLGVKDNSNKLCLTAWNGEILWERDLGEDGKANVYEIAYNFASNTISVMLSNQESGLFAPSFNKTTRKETFNKLWVLQPNGEEIARWSLNTNAMNFPEFALTAQRTMRGLFLDQNSMNIDGLFDSIHHGQNWRMKDLYDLNVLATDYKYQHPKQPNMFLTYMPNYMQLFQGENLPSMTQVLSTFDELNRFFFMERHKLSSSKFVSIDLETLLKNKTKPVFLDVKNGLPALYFQNETTGKNDWVHLNNAYLLTNPFWTNPIVTYGANQINEYATRRNFDLHFLFGVEDQNRTFHLVIRFSLDNSVPNINWDNVRVEQLSAVKAPGDITLTTSPGWYKNWKYLNRNVVINQPANTRINHNLFDPNLLTFAYPYQMNNSKVNVVDDSTTNSKNKGSAFPIYNVAQLRFNSKTGLVERQPGTGKLYSHVYNIGKDLVERLGKDAFPNEDKDSLIHKFHRLVAVSPFDQSFVYNATANLSGLNGYGVHIKNDSFLNYWVVQAFKPDSSNYHMKPVTINNGDLIGQAIDQRLVNVYTLLRDGFTFDLISSLESKPNLYFNATGLDANQDTHGAPAGWTTTKIGMIPQIKLDLIRDFKVQTNGKTTQQTITADSYPVLIHSRAKLSTWFNRTKFSLENPTNMIKTGTLLNKGNAGGTKAIINNWNNPIAGDSQDQLDVVSNYRSSGLRQYLAIQNPNIKMGSRNGGPDIELVAEFQPSSTKINLYSAWFPNVSHLNVDKLTYKDVNLVSQSSFEVFGKVGPHFKMSTFQNDNASNANTFNSQIVTRPEWFDIRKSGNVNDPWSQNIFNAMEVNGKSPLRVLLQIVKPTNAPAWMSKIDQRFFQPAPIDNRHGNETLFSNLLAAYRKELINRINTDENSVNPNGTFGLNNLTIRASLALNPTVAQNGAIYDVNGKKVMKSLNGFVYSYQDRSAANEGIIYKQEAASYEDLGKQGLGSAVESLIKPNWVSLPANKKIVFSAKIDELKWPILNFGPSFGKKGLIFEAYYTDGNRNQIALKALEAAKTNWLYNTLTTLNFKYGLWAWFEYLDGLTWKPIGNKLSDAQIKAMYNTKTKEFTIPVSATNIKKLRIRLVPQTEAEFNNDANAFTKWNPLPSANENKFLSAEHNVAANPIKIDPQWFSTIALGSAQTLDQVSTKDFETYENQIKTEFQKLNPQQTNDLWSKIDIIYHFNGQDYNSESAIATALRNAVMDLSRTDQGWFYLWTGSAKDTVGRQILQARFRIKDAFANDYVFADPNGQVIGNPEALAAPVKSTIKAKFDLKPYFDDLSRNPLISTAQNLEISKINIPLGATGIFQGKDFKAVIELLRRVGIKLQFQSWNPTASDWNKDWVDNLSQIKTYNPSNPQFKIRAIVDKPDVYTTSSAYYDRQLMDDGFGGVLINLQLPKLVKAASGFADELKKLVMSDHPFAGNSKILVINNIEQFNQKLVKSIQNASTSSGSNNYNDLANFLVINYQMANSGWKSASDLKYWAQTQTTDLIDNKIEMQFSLKNMNPTYPEYTLDQSLVNPFVIHDNQNSVVPLYIHGQEWEQAIQTIEASGTRQNLNFDWSQAAALEELKSKTVNGVNLEWRFQDANHEDLVWKKYIEKPLPNNLQSDYPEFINSQAIELRIKQDDNVKNYYYGPERDNNGAGWSKGIISLTNLNYLVQVDTTWFNNTKMSANEIDINDIDLKLVNNWTQSILNHISEDNLRSKVDVQFNIVWPQANEVASKSWLNANQLVATLKQAQVDWNNPNHFAIISLYDQNASTIQASSQTKIMAKFTSKQNSQISFVDLNNQIISDDKKLQSWVNTTGISTTIDLSHYVNQLETQLTTVVSNNPATGQIDRLDVVANNGGNWLFSNQSFEVIESLLARFEIKIYFSSDVNQVANRNWTNKQNLTHYDPQQAKLLVAFENNSQNLKVKLNEHQTLEITQNSKNNPSFINLNVPKLVYLQNYWFDDFKTNHGFSGNTKHLTIDQSKIDQLIERIKQELAQINSELQKAPLEVVFGLNNSELMRAAELKNYLANQASDQITNVLKMQVRLKPNVSKNEWILDGYSVNQPQNVFETLNSPIQIYLHDDGIDAALSRPHLSGDNTNLQWSFSGLEVNKKSGLITKPNKQNALVIEYNPKSASENDPNWTKVQPNQIDPNSKEMWIRLNWADPTQNRFVLGDPLTQANPFSTNSTIKKAIKVNLDDIKRILHLQTAWLKQIKARGNLVNLSLDESNLETEFKQILPADEIANLEAQYSISNNQWFNANEFKEFLKVNQGQSPAGFILRREEIKVRFGLAKNVPFSKYGWVIDGQKVTSLDDYQNHYQKLIDDGLAQNHDVKGIINLKLVPQFTAGNFSIRGSNNHPKLEVRDDSAMASQFSPYETDQIFKISLTTTKNGNNWDWTNAITIFERGSFRSDLNGLTLDASKQAAIRFQVWDPTNDPAQSKYQLINSQTEQILDISNNVKVVTEIENPFSKHGKTLAIQIRDDQNRPRWKQGEGQLRIVVGDANNVPEKAIQSALEFLDQSGLSSDQRDKLEFVYQVFPTEPTAEQINGAKDHNNITNPSSNWRVFQPDDKGWSTNLKLEVGNFAMVALRIKPEFATGNQAYVLANNDHSVLIPVNSQSGTNQPIAIRKPGRIAGLLVEPEQAKIDTSGIKLSSITPSNGQLLDGWTVLDELVLENRDNHASGIDLKIELFTDFHRSPTDDRILVSASNSKLVKRKQKNHGMTEGLPYLNENDQEIVDKNNETVKMWWDPATGHLAAPDEANAATRSMVMTNDRPGQYQLQIDTQQKDEWSLFKNQRVLITYQAKQGEGTKDLPDFELTHDFQQDLKDIISKRIKFTLENPQNVAYDWANRDAFSDENIEFESTDTNDTKPTNGASKVKTLLKLKRYSKNNADADKIISGATSSEAIAKIEQQIQNDFGNQLQFSYQHIRKDGSVSTYNQTANFYDLVSLKNGDTVKLSLKAADPDLVFLDAPQDLIFTVSGLVVEAPSRTALQHLRVEQGGRINGQGTFRVLVHNPADPYQDPDKILKGWKFLVRVWNKDKKIKFNWTDDQSKIVGLENGDKVEWKLADESNNPVKDAYYNTVAGKHNLTSDGAVQLQFEQVNYSNGPEHKVVVAPGIGDYPAKENENQYPESTGFVIGGLQERLLRFDLTQIAFERIINTLRPHYKGLDGHGVLNFDEKFMDGTWWVNHQGEIYQKEAESSARLASNSEVQPEAISLEQFFAHTTFYTANPATTPSQLGWQFMSNATAVDHRLWNGNQLWARFDVAQSEASETKRNLSGQFANYNQSAGSTFLLATLPPVSELTTVPDPMSPLWWALVALGAILTLGILPIIIWRYHHKKLQEPKF